jgi:hypothetical protein
MYISKDQFPKITRGPQYLYIHQWTQSVIYMNTQLLWPQLVSSYDVIILLAPLFGLASVLCASHFGLFEGEIICYSTLHFLLYMLCMQALPLTIPITGVGGFKVDQVLHGVLVPTIYCYLYWALLCWLWLASSSTSTVGVCSLIVMSWQLWYYRATGLQQCLAISTNGPSMKDL